MFEVQKVFSSNKILKIIAWPKRRTQKTYRCKKQTQENAPNLAQKLLLRAFEADQENFPGCYFANFAIIQKLFGIF